MQAKDARDQINKQTYTLDKMEFFEKRLTKVEDALVVERANYSMEKCKAPVDIVKRVLASNLKEVTTNIQQCTQKAQTVNKETNQVGIDYEKANVCLERNMEIMHLLNKKIGLGLSGFRDEFM